MARVTKDCPDCGSAQPCTITSSPQTKDSVGYGVVCDTCGHAYVPDADFEVRDGKGWADRVRAAHGQLLDPDGKPYPDPGA